MTEKVFDLNQDMTDRASANPAVPVLEKRLTGVRLGLKETVQLGPGFSDFAETVKRISGLDVNLCFQCAKCASGCPVSYAMDYTPTQLVHAIQLGLTDLVLNSNTIWLCASCQTCTTRCPQDVDVAKVMDALRIMAIRSGVKPKVPEVAAFYRASLFNIRFFGRMYELGLIAMLKLSTGQLTKDLGLGIKMLKKGKLKLLPTFRGSSTTRRLFAKVKEQEKV